MKRLLFSSLNRNIILNNNISERANNVVRLYCNQDGIVQKLDNNIVSLHSDRNLKVIFQKLFKNIFNLFVDGS